MKGETRIESSVEARDDKKINNRKSSGQAGAALFGLFTVWV